MSGVDEFEAIARLMRPLAQGAPEALDLLDDAAVIESRPGYDLVVTNDALVEGVHFLPSDPLDMVARKLLRVNLSDLAAKGATPHGYFLACAWPASRDWDDRKRFSEGLAADQAAFEIKLFGGDTTATKGPMVFSVTLLGWVKHGRMVRRAGAKAGDLVQVSGPIGDGWLGLQAALGGLGEVSERTRRRLAVRFQLPEPRVGISLAGATAAADISDGLIADAGHIAEASGVGMEIELTQMPMSAEAAEWMEHQTSVSSAAALATGGDDYEIVATAPERLDGFDVIGKVVAEPGVRVFLAGAPIDIARTGWRHGNEA